MSGDISSPIEVDREIVLGRKLRYPDDFGYQSGGRLDRE